jgi:hypothetical protein
MGVVGSEPEGGWFCLIEPDLQIAGALIDCGTLQMARQFRKIDGCAAKAYGLGARIGIACDSSGNLSALGYPVASSRLYVSKVRIDAKSGTVPARVPAFKALWSYHSAIIARLESWHLPEISVASDTDHSYAFANEPITEAESPQIEKSISDRPRNPSSACV